MLFINSAACFALLALAQSFTSVSAQSGGFRNSCRQCTTIRSSGASGAYILVCDCGDGRGNYLKTQIHLGDCFGNYGGVLTFQHNGGFQGSCTSVKGPTNADTSLTATCGNGRGGYSYGNIDSNKYIGNTRGQLVC